MLSRDDVFLAYNAVLRRPPESEAAIQEHLGHASIGELCAAMLGSEEFRSKFGQELGL